MLNNARFSKFQEGNSIPQRQPSGKFLPNWVVIRARISRSRQIENASGTQNFLTLHQPGSATQTIGWKKQAGKIGQQAYPSFSI